MAVFAQDSILVSLFMENHGAGLADQLQAALGPLQQLKVLLAGKTPVGLVGIEGEAVKKLRAFRAARFGGPFGECAGEILRDRHHQSDHWAGDDRAAFIAAYGDPFDDWWDSLPSALRDALLAYFVSRPASFSAASGEIP